MSDLRKKLTSGAAWMVSMRFVVNMLGIVSTIVLARLLTPTDFGIVALAGSAYAFFSVFGQIGFDSALIYIRDPDLDHYSSAWTANILVGLGIACAMFVVAGPVATFFDNPAIREVVYAFSILSLAKGCENIGVVNFRKHLNFRGDFLYFVLPKVVSVIVAVVAAYLLRNYWALVIGMTASQVTTLLYSHLSQPLRPRLKLNRFRELFGFSRWILISKFIDYASRNGLEIVLGRIRDSAAVGIFGISRQIAALPSTELTAPINRALFPSLATISDDKSRLKNIVVQVLAMTALISLPAAFGILATADYLVPTLLGEKWLDATPVLVVLGFFGVLDSMKSLFTPIMLACGKPNILTWQGAIYAAVVLPLSIVLAGKLGAVGVGYAMIGGTIVTLPVIYVAVRRVIALHLSDYFAAVWRPLVASVLMALAIAAVSTPPVTPGGSIPRLALLVLMGAVTYFVLLLLLWRLAGKPAGAESRLLDFVKARIVRGGVRR